MYLYLILGLVFFCSANELRLRCKLRDLGLTQRERSGGGGAAKTPIPMYHDTAAEDEDNRCDVSKKICYLSMVSGGPSSYIQWLYCTLVNEFM